MSVFADISKEHKAQTGGRGRAAPSPSLPSNLHAEVPREDAPRGAQARCPCGGGPSCEHKEPPQLQTKLQMSHAGDASERKADSVAEQVMRMAPTGRVAGAQAKPGAERAGGASACGVAPRARRCRRTRPPCRAAVLLASYKRHRHEAEKDVPTLYNRFVSAIRQPLESLFNWLIQRTDLQNAARVRSSQGLKVHCYGKLAVACLLLTFYS